MTTIVASRFSFATTSTPATICCRSIVAHRAYLLGCDNVCGVGERGEYVVAGNAVFVSYLVRRQAGSHLSDDDIDGHPGAADHRPARSDLGIDDDVRCKLGR